MDSVNRIVQSISLPLSLPEGSLGKTAIGRDMLDVTMVVSMLPRELYPYLDLDVTASHSRNDGQIIYRLLLVDEGTLKIRVQNHSIVEVTRIWDY